jgi:hypothetical protein
MLSHQHSGNIGCDNGNDGGSNSSLREESEPNMMWNSMFPKPEAALLPSLSDVRYSDSLTTSSSSSSTSVSLSLDSLTARSKTRCVYAIGPGFEKFKNALEKVAKLKHVHHDEIG